MENFSLENKNPDQEKLQKKFEYYKKDFPLTQEELQGSLLDVGASTGEFVQYLRDVLHNTDAKAVEFQEAKIKPENSEWHIQADGLELPFEDNSFETVTAHNYLPMFIGDTEKMEKAITELLRVVKQNGRVMGDIATPEFVKKSNDEIKKNLGEEYSDRDEARFKEDYKGAEHLQDFLETLKDNHDVQLLSPLSSKTVLIIKK
jgi:ubiquinone/menaquinone biosynthesis C-methylase UbiE